MTTASVGESDPAGSAVERAQALYRQRLNAGYRDTDPLFAVLLLLEWLLGIVFATLISPYAWAGETVSLHIMVWAAVILGARSSACPSVWSCSGPVRQSRAMPWRSGRCSCAPC